MKIPSGSRKTGSRAPADSGKPVSGDEVLARNQAARKNSRPLLDPHGIYGTRSAYRVRTAQRRRRMQTLSVLTAIVVAGLGVSYWWRENSIPRLKPLWRSSLVGQPVGMPAWGAWQQGQATPEVFMVVPTERGSLLTVDATGGKLNASFRTGMALRAQPLIAASTAYAPCDDGSLFAVDWRRGKLLWKYWSGATISARPADAKMYGVVPGQPGLNLRPMVVVGDDAGTISGLNALNGKPIWRKTLGAPVGNGLTPVHGVMPGASNASVVLVPFLAGLGTEGGMACLDSSSGRVIWRAELGAAFLPAPVVQGRGSAARVLCIGDNGSIIALEMATGRKIWKTYAQPLASNPENSVVFRGEPLLVNIGNGAALVCGANDGGIRAFDAQNGRLLWTFEAGAPVRSKPRLVSLKDGRGTSRDVLLVGSDSRFAFGLDARTGELLWRCETSGTAFATPGVHDKAVICLTREGGIYAFALPK